MNCFTFHLIKFFIKLCGTEQFLDTVLSFLFFFFFLSSENFNADRRNRGGSGREIKVK